MSNIMDFPLIWRWTSPTHALFSASELAALRPCTHAEVARVRDETRVINLREGLDARQFRNVRQQSADISTSEGCKWLRTQAPDLSEQVIVSWDVEMALRAPWEFFTARWDDFCYPASDDVLVIPDTGNWVLRYHHEEIFYFGDDRVCR
jgi:hypothetical protein